MEKQIKFYLTIPFVGLVTLALLMIPFTAMQFSSGFDWSFFDFFLAGVLIFGTGVLIVLVFRMTASIIYRAAVAIAIGTTLLMIWSNIAVGLIGAGPHLGNFMYAGVVAILFIGIYLSRFTPTGLERAMLVTGLSFLLLAAVALMMGMQHYPQSSVTEIISVNLFFATPFIVSGLMFRYVALRESGNQ